MTNQFRIVFTVQVSHAYYTEGYTDFSFVIPSDTAKLLKNGKLVFKVHNGVLLVLFQADEAGSAFISLAGENLRIGLKSDTPFFGNITAFDEGIDASTPFYRNANAPNALDEAKGVVLVGQIFSHSITDTARPVTVTLKDARGQILQVDTKTTSNDGTTVSYDLPVLTGQTPGVYRVEEDYPGTGAHQAITYYSDAHMQRTGVFGIIEIRLDSSFYTAPPAFTVALKAREEVLKYYVVVKNYTAHDVNRLSVEDAGFEAEGRTRVVFDRVPSDQFTPADIDPALLTGNDDRVVLFKSQTVVARSEKARKNIQLKKNGEVLIKHLPQVGAEKINGDIIIQISKP